MEQKNLLLAIVLSAIIMVGFQWYSASQRPEQPVQTAEQKKAAAIKPGTATSPALPSTSPGTTLSAPSSVPGAPGVAVPLPGVNGAAQKAEELKKALTASPRLRIESDRVTGSISLVGARIDDLTLKDYRETIEKDSKNISLLLPFGSSNPYYADFGWVSADTKVPDANTVWTASNQTLSPKAPVNLTWQNPAGVKFIQELSLDENYMFSVNQRVENSGNKPATVFPFGRISRTGTPEITDFYILHEGLLGVFDGVLTEIDYDEIQETKLVQNKTKGGWIGITDKYWLTALIPDQKSATDTRFSDQIQKKLDTYQVDFRGDAQTIAPGATAETSSKFFAGAKEAQLIIDYRDQHNISRFDLAIDWGWFEFLTKPIFFALVYFTDYLGNMGLSILLLTVLIKLAFFPLANKSYRAMSKMKLLQPEMVKLRERFKDDRARMNQEVMQLYKREKANPASGCLPILPQIPVFFALYKVVFVTIELRHAPFYGWIHDLSAADPLTPFNLFGLINWTPPEIIAIGVWPIIMGVTMFIQQKLNPPPPDPMQAKIFMFLPIMFTFMLARFPAGLVIYWAWNNALSVLQQYVIMRKAGAPIGNPKKT
ncbi:MAG: membrane protein insertase YidC [Rhodospirillaceae bacterium]|jgi:YidC/Oxa1 family membrane protein insertase|nr:membrane protein insertase YidC [Rhodospirillaceae bacterium]MBT4588454.1 membrane protein insertase YidC [Rhodospirillaceae bacterium]MBT4941061.1 membrane protein insertase YidC [Rhodospirillaceae bacterium]MBT7265544.1 membrane protein insertase YidC [Rhodospirillaceae bacterium]